ncbi:phosphopentomutase [Candidatus Fermentibacterales bacterium]|nr:phosphopentomutase [Candidatus Fermentibacterales bacterium]
MSRALLLVLDGVGAGEAPDARDYGDEGSDTLGNLSRAMGGLDLPCLGSLGLGNAHGSIMGVPPVERPLASFGSMLEASAGKDSTTGHWEMMGIVTAEPFPTYPSGFPPEVIRALESAAGRKLIGNTPASGTRIIEELGPEHQRTGALIVYTSADSVLQIAAHEGVIEPQELYDICERARQVMLGPHAVSRVIARPFVGSPGSYVRTPGRRDFSIEPPGPGLLDLMEQAGIARTGVGKVDDLFAGRSITTTHVRDNAEGLEVLLEMLRSTASGLIFANLCDFDTRWGHRNDMQGFARGLEEVDRAMPALLEAISEGEIMIATADHGNDPTTSSTDHSRERVPLIAYSPGRSGADLGTRSSFSDAGATLAELFGMETGLPGESFLSAVMGTERE